MNLLLDTHVVLWWLNDSPLLIKSHRELIENSGHLCYISAATIWEISIKSSLGKLEISPEYTIELLKEGFLELPVSWKHCSQVRSLPIIHRDPFDRLLIAQAQLEGMTILSVDEFIKKYDVPTL